MTQARLAASVLSRSDAMQAHCHDGAGDLGASGSYDLRQPT